MVPVREITMFATLPSNAHPEHRNADATQVLPHTNSLELNMHWTMCLAKWFPVCAYRFETHRNEEKSRAQETGQILSRPKWDVYINLITMQDTKVT